MLQGVTSGYRGTGGDKVLEGLTRGYMGLLGVTSVYKALQGEIGGYRG